jgi:hypothetical protein
VLASVLAHPVNANWKIQGRALVNRINGVRIEKLEDVIRALQSSQAAEHQIEFISNGAFECVDRLEADKANDEILKTYGLPSDRRL